MFSFCIYSLCSFFFFFFSSRRRHTRWNCDWSSDVCSSDLETTAGEKILDACSGGAMVACLGHGVREIADAAAAQAEQIAYFYNHHFTSRPQEELADRVIE